MSEPSGQRAALAARLAALRAAGLVRALSGRNGLDMVSNDYLGLADDARLAAAMREALAAGVPAGAGASRLLGGNHAAFEAIETRLAAFSGSDSALLFSSGYAANLGLLQAVLEDGDLVVSDALNHASLIDGLRLARARRVVVSHHDLAAVEAALKQRTERRAFVVTESVFSMEGDHTPLAELADLAERWDAALIVDEAHATGLYGGRGSGRVEELGLRDRVLATVHTGGKALGVGGAWVAGPPELRDLLVNRARTFVFSTGPLPVLAAGLGAALDVAAAEPDRRHEVHRKAALLRGALGDGGVAARGQAPIVPLVVGDPAAAVRLQEALRAAGFDVRAVRPPTVPDGTARLRITVRYPVSDDDLRRFAGEAARLLATRAA